MGMGPRNRVLVIEDDHDTRQSLCDLLTQAGYRADAAVDPEAALRCAHRSETSAVLIDGERCSRDAGSGLAELRHRVPNAAIVVTARGDNHRCILRSLGTCAEAYLLKPPRPNDLATTFARLANHAINGSVSHRSPRSRFRAAFEGADFGMLILEATAGRVVTANRTAEQLLGHPVGGLLDHPMSRLIHPDDRPDFRALYNGLVHDRAGPFGLRCHVTDRTGEPLATRLTLSAMPGEGGVISHVAVLMDAPSARHRAELLRSELEAVWDSTDDAIIRIDLDGSITAWNPGAEQTYGYTAAEAIGRDLSMLLPDDRRDELTDTLRPLRDGHRIERLQTVHLGRDREPRDLSLTGCPIHGADGRPAAAVLVARDQTREFALEQRILEASACEQRRIGQDLHDGLGQELTGIAFLARSLRDQLAEAGLPQADRADQIVGFIHEAITHAKALVKGLRPTDLEGEGLVQALRHLAEATSRTHHIECELEADDSIQGPDPDTALHLYYITREALNNAVHHGRAQRIRLRLDATEDSLRLSIRDNGVGLSPEGRQNPGSGLDIMNCRAQMIGGSLKIRGAAERGTEVACCVDLPTTPTSATGQ